MRRPNLTPDEILFIIHNYGRLSTAHIAHTLNVSTRVVYARAKRLNLKCGGPAELKIKDTAWHTRQSRIPLYRELAAARRPLVLTRRQLTTTEVEVEIAEVLPARK